MLNEDKADDLVSVLRNLGYKKVEAERRALGTLQQHSEEEVPLETLIKTALAWSHRETGSIKVVAEEVASMEATHIVGGNLPVPPKPKVAKLVYVPPEGHEDGNTEETPTPGVSGGSVLLGVMLVFGALAGLVMWIGIAKFAMALAGLITFFFIIGKMSKDKGE